MNTSIDEYSYLSRDFSAEGTFDHSPSASQTSEDFAWDSARQSQSASPPQATSSTVQNVSYPGGTISSHSFSGASPSLVSEGISWDSLTGATEEALASFMNPEIFPSGVHHSSAVTFSPTPSFSPLVPSTSQLASHPFLDVEQYLGDHPQSFPGAQRPLRLRPPHPTSPPVSSSDYMYEAPLPLDRSIPISRRSRDFAPIQPPPSPPNQ